MAVFTKSYTNSPIFTWSIQSAESRLIFSSTHISSIWMVPGTFSLEA